MILQSSVGCELVGEDLRLSLVGRTTKGFRLLRSVELSGFLKGTLEERRQSLLDAVRRHRLSGFRAFLSLPHESGVLRQYEFPPEVADKLKDVVALQIESLSPWSVEEVYYDFSPRSPKPGARFTVTIAILPRQILDQWLELFRQSGLALSGVTLAPASFAHFLLVGSKSTNPWLVVRQGSEKTEVVLVDQFRLVSAVEKGATEETAGPLAQRLVASAHLQDVTRIQMLDLREGKASAGDFKRLFQVENAAADSKQWGAMIGAFAGFGKGPFRLNIVPRELRRGSNRWLWAPTIALAAAVVVIGVLSVLREPYQMSVYAAGLRQAVNEVTPSIKELSKQETHLNGLAERQRLLAAELNPDHNLEALAELSRILPPDAWVVSYANQNGAVSVTGYANSAAAVQKAMEDSPVFAGVQFAAPITKDGPQDHFSLKCSIEGQ